MGSSSQHVVALKDFYNGPCGPANDRPLRSNWVLCHLSTLNTYINRFAAQDNLETVVGTELIENMWSCKMSIVVVSFVVIAMMEWNDHKFSSAMVSATDSVVDVDGVPTKVVYYSRKRDLWSKRGVRSLLRSVNTTTTAPSGSQNLDPIGDSADLASCIEICLINNCYGSVNVEPTQATAAPTTAP